MKLPPWTPDEVDSLNRWQKFGMMKPEACVNGHGPLVATTKGWICTQCDYTQNWCHEYQAKLPKGLGD